jgi:hydrogenase maturation protease
MLILGCGNPERSDDAAGLLVARRLRELGINALECRGDMLRLMEIWNGSKEVGIVDAVVSGAAPGTIHVWDALDSPLPRDCFPSSTHHLGVADAVELARALGRLPPKLILYGIEAAKFGRGQSLSPEVGAAVKQLVQDIAATQQPRPHPWDVAGKPEGTVIGQTPQQPVLLSAPSQVPVIPRSGLPSVVRQKQQT